MDCDEKIGTIHITLHETNQKLLVKRQLRIWRLRNSFQWISMI